MLTDDAQAWGMNATSPFGMFTWNQAEFGIYGDGDSSQAIFGAGTTLTVRTSVHHGNKDQPACVATNGTQNGGVNALTNETNNLQFATVANVEPGAPGDLYPPYLATTQSNDPATYPALDQGAPGACQAAQGTGDTHLMRYDRSLVDDQAQGDFTYAENPSFVVQTRQRYSIHFVGAAVNSAVATQMGNTRVAVCLPGRLVVNGATKVLPEGKTLALPGGVDIWRTSPGYVIRDHLGNSVVTRLNSVSAPAESWIDVFVGLGESPSTVQGLLGNSSSTGGQFVTPGGRILKAPSLSQKQPSLPFKQFYAWSDTWRVKPAASLLNACGSSLKTPPRNPDEPFYAKDLPPKVAKPALATCTKAGVNQALLDACTLDVAVTGSPRAARPYIGAKAPKLVVALR